MLVKAVLICKMKLVEQSSKLSGMPLLYTPTNPALCTSKIYQSTFWKELPDENILTFIILIYLTLFIGYSEPDMLYTEVLQDMFMERATVATELELLKSSPPRSLCEPCCFLSLQPSASPIHASNPSRSHALWYHSCSICLAKFAYKGKERT